MALPLHVQSRFYGATERKTRLDADKQTPDDDEEREVVNVGIYWQHKISQIMVGNINQGCGRNSHELFLLCTIFN